MATLPAVIPPRTRQFIKDVTGLERINRHLAVLDQKLTAVPAEALSELAARTSSLEARLRDPRKEFSTAFWYDTSYAEPCVALALRDLCRPGDVVFDVGANCGALSILMSRLVGPKGVVCSFEASRRIVDKCQYNLVVNGCHNSQLFHRAVYSRSGETLKIYHGTHLNDTVVQKFADTHDYDTVETISLDDFVAELSLHPKVIKMDIEHAEYDALLGARGTLAGDRPILILEQQPSDTRCLDLLKELGYAGIDLATYQEVACAADFPPGVNLANVLFMHRSAIDETPYRLPIERRQTHALDKAAFETAADGIHLLKPVELDPGRYLIRTEFTADRADNEAIAGVEADGVVVFRYHTNTRFLATAYRDWVVSIARRQSVDLFIRFLNGTSDPTLAFHGAAIYQLPRFSHPRRAGVA